MVAVTWAGRAMLAAQAQAQAHNGIFIVDDADRRRIDDKSDRPALTDRAWHTARLVRTASTGRLEVFVDGETAPIMTATDRTIPSGRLAWGRSTTPVPSGASTCRASPRPRPRPPEPGDPAAGPVFRYTTGLRKPNRRPRNLPGGFGEKAETGTV